jgi:hypothetical protein
MNKDGQKAFPPPLAGTPAGKSKLPLIVAVVVALSSSAANAEGSGSSANNPVLGEWVLVNAEDAAYCPTYQQFTPSKHTFTQRNGTYNTQPVYDIRPGVTIVGHPGTTYQGEWRATGPDDMVLGQAGPPPYGIASHCAYHRK